MFSWKFCLIFQKNHLVEHSQLAVFLIRWSFLVEWQLPISFLDSYVFSEYFSLRSELLLNCVDAFAFSPSLKKYFFALWGAIIEITFDWINQ